jgi:hypothetical protein
MTLAQLNQDLTADQLYPDLAHMLHWYTIPSLRTQTFADAMRDLGFRHNQRAGGMLGAIDIPQSGDPEGNPRRIPVVITRIRDSVGLKFPVNVLRILHAEETRDFGEERSTTGTNWLHPDAFDDSGPVWARLYEETVAIALHIDQLADNIAARMRPAGVAVLRDQRVNTIEICADFEAENPRAVFRRFLPRFKERYRRVQFLGYGRGTRARWTGELFHDCNLIRGYLSEGISFKIYVKTNRRIRLEIEYKRDGLSRVRGSSTEQRAPVAVDADELQGLWHFLAEHCLPEMNDLLQRARPIPAAYWDLERLLTAVAPIICRWSRAELQSLATALMHDNRITTRTLPSRKLARLRRSGVLTNTRHGVYAVAPECQIAFRSLLSASLLCQRGIARAQSAAAEPADSHEDDLDYPEAAD